MTNGASKQGGQKAMTNGASKVAGAKAVTAVKSAAAVGPDSKGYHATHQNALHFMAKTASEYL
jgi:hypothetical protein